jgi:hypothetical protein
VPIPRRPTPADHDLHVEVGADADERRRRWGRGWGCGWERSNDAAFSRSWRSRSCSASWSEGATRTTTVDQFGGAEISGVLSSTFPTSAYAAVSVLFRDQSGAPVYGASDSIAVDPGATSFRFNSDEAVPPEWTATIFASPQGIYYY